MNFVLFYLFLLCVFGLMIRFCMKKSISPQGTETITETPSKSTTHSTMIKKKIVAGVMAFSLLSVLIPMTMDLPNAVTHHYQSLIGRVERDTFAITSISTSHTVHLYWMDREESTYGGKTVQVDYLPHSHFGINIMEIE